MTQKLLIAGDKVLVFWITFSIIQHDNEFCCLYFFLWRAARVGYQRLQELFPALQNETWENHTCIKSIITATALNVWMDSSPEQTEGGKQ